MTLEEFVTKYYPAQVREFQDASIPWETIGVGTTLTTKANGFGCHEGDPRSMEIIEVHPNVQHPYWVIKPRAPRPYEKGDQRYIVLREDDNWRKFRYWWQAVQIENLVTKT